MQTHVQTGSATPPANVVLADSRERVRETLAQTIRDQRDLRVLAAYETTQQTWRSLRQTPPEILLLDWRLPDAGGMTLLRRLSPGPDLKVILLTEERSPEVLAQSMILGARGVISRTAHPDTVLRSARAVLNGELWYPRSVTRALRDHIAASRAGRLFPAAAGALFPTLDELLTRREADVVREVSRGRTNLEIAGQLGISPLTVRHHLKSIFGKLHLNSRLELALLANSNRL